MMELSLEQYEQIQEYLDGIMPPAKMDTFEKMLAADKTLNDYFLFEKQLRDGLQYSEALEDAGMYDYEPRKKGDSPLDDPGYISRMIASHAADFEKQKNNPIDFSNTDDDDVRIQDTTTDTRVISLSTNLRLAIAACILLVLAGALWFALRYNHGINNVAHKDPDKDSLNKDPQNQIAHEDEQDSINRIQPKDKSINLASLFDSFFKKDKVPEESPQLLAYALDDYANNSYTSLQQMDIDNLPISRDVTDVQQQQRIRELAHYYKGLALLMDKGNAAKAIREFKWVADKSSNTQLKSKAQWYQALAYLKVNNSAAAILLLTPLSENTHAADYQQQAIELLNKLRS